MEEGDGVEKLLSFEDDNAYHPVQEHRDWRESYYVNFADPNSDLVGVIWQGAKENQQVGDAVFLLCDGKTDLVRSVKMGMPLPPGTDPGRRLGPQHFVCHAPWRHWSAHYADGDAKLDVDWTQLSETCDWNWEDLTNSKHFQAAGKVRVTGSVNGRLIDFEGYGERDRAWGARNYGPLRFSVFMTAQFPDDVAVHSFVLRDRDGGYRLFGYLHKDGITRDLARCEATLEYDGERGPPLSGSFHLVDADGREVEMPSFALMNHVAFGGHGDGSKLGGGLETAQNLMFLTFQSFTRSDGVRGKGMIDLNVWPGEQQSSFLATAPSYSTLYPYGRHD